jgi:hypothetical protein
MRNPHVIVALGNSWGRARIARAIAMALSANGERVTLLASDALAPGVEGRGYRTRPVRQNMGPLLAPYLDELLVKERPETIVLCDYPSNATVLRRNGVEPASLLREGIRACTLDIWDTALTGVEPDIFGHPTPHATEHAWIGGLDRTDRLCPVPILWPRSGAGSHFCYLPESIRPASAARGEVRARLGIGPGEKMVLFCTAAWQHLPYASAAGRRMSSSMPRLVAQYIQRAGSDVHLVHLGPEAFDLEACLGSRYHWVPPMPAAAFDTLLASADVMLSANVAASTVAAAMLLDVPALVLRNAVSARTVDDVEAAIGGPVSSDLRRWLSESLPLYPFALWPIGYYEFLSPVLRGNPYAEALTTVDMLHEDDVSSALTRLLRDPGPRAAQIDRQTRYLNRIRSLPSVVELIVGPTAR